MIEDYYNTTAVVRSQTTERTNMGGVKNTYATRITALQCRMTPKTLRESDEYGKVTMREVWILYCAATATNKAIVESDRVEVDTRTFEITGIANPGLMDHHLEIALKELH